SHFTIVPSEYVCVAGRLTVGVSGSCTEIRNSANWSAAMPVPGAAVHVTERTVPAAASRSSWAVQPGIASVLADATLGRTTLNCVVRAPFSDSLGTLKVTTE